VKPRIPEHVVYQAFLVVVPDDAEHVRQRRDVAFASGRIAAGHDYPDVWVISGDATDRLAGTLIGGRGHGARVDDDEIRIERRSVDCSTRAKRLLDAERVRLIHAATERHDRVLHPHPTGGPEFLSKGRTLQTV
jgi:hypothetical protein